ncbi:helix-turn-helix domain-containing protein [Streptomyces sp. NBC_01264]|uniref:helix-turn-helix domain-containing protein n=1 Tax=Streptomyces sp. NBC_01264 TaxID=2903804 RepID=UPI003D2FB1CB
MTQSVTELGLPTPKERRRLREAADLTHEEVAAAVGVTSNTVRSWETGRSNPRGRKLEAYSKLLSRLSADTSPDSAPSGPTARAEGSPARNGPDRAEGPDAGSATDPAQVRSGGAGASEATTGTPDRPTRRPAWANGTAAPRTDARAVGASAPGDRTTTGPAGSDTDADEASGAFSGPPDSAAEGTGAAAGAAPVDAEASGVPFGLRMMRGLTRPVGAQTRPKAAVKRAAKPPVGMPRHEAKSPVKAGAAAATGGGHGGGGRAALRPGGPLLPSTGTGTGTGTNTGTGATSDTGSDPGSGPDSDPRSGKAAAPGTGNPVARTSTTGSGSGAATGPGSDPDPARDSASDSDSPSGSVSDSLPDFASAEPGGGTDKAGGPAVGAGTGPGVDPGADPDDTTAEAAPKATPVSAFDALYDRTAAALARQAYLLTGRHSLACEAVERAFQQAWDRWPEVATDPDPVGWVRAATYEYALSPWHRFRRSHRHPDEPPADPADRVLLDAMLELPPAHRRTVLLYDGVGLDLPDTAAETEASTPTAGSRLVDAHADLADVLPELDGVPPAKQSAVLRERLGTLRPAALLEPRAAAVVRVAGEHRNRLWTRAVVGVSAVIAAATAYTWVTAPTEYEPPRAPGASVSGVPPHGGPQHLTDEGRQLHDKLLSDPAAGPSRISPSLE